MKRTLMRIIGLSLNGLALVTPRKAAQLGFNLFCYPFRTPLTEKQKLFLQTAKQSSFLHRGTKIQTYRWGNGAKNILLLHGWQSHSYRWKIYIESLNKEEYSIYSMDAPGHGLSGGKHLSVPLYGEVIETFVREIGEVDSIICHSLGSFSTIYTLHKNPKISVRKVVAMAPPGEAQEFFDFYTRSLKLSVRTTTLIANRFLELFNNLPDYFSVPRFAASLNIPGLIIHDEEDRETDVDNATKIHHAWKKSKLIVTKGYGHNLKSTEVLKEVIDYVNQPLPDQSLVPTSTN